MVEPIHGYVVVHRGKRHVHSCPDCEKKTCECIFDARRSAAVLNQLFGGSCRVERLHDGVLLSSHTSTECRETFVRGPRAA